MKVTISDVARLAGVSTATVSHTINNTRYVSEETKEKVYQAIDRAGIVNKLGKDNVLDHIDKALERAEQLSKQIEK